MKKLPKTSKLSTLVLVICGFVATRTNNALAQQITEEPSSVSPNQAQPAPSVAPIEGQPYELYAAIFIFLWVLLTVVLLVQMKKNKKR